MEILILKNNEIFARSSDSEHELSDIYRIELIEELPEYPGRAPRGKEWVLVWNDGEPRWQLQDRPLTPEERIADLEAGLSELLGGVQ